MKGDAGDRRAHVDEIVSIPTGRPRAAPERHDDRDHQVGRTTHAQASKNTSVRTSMLSRAGASGAADGSRNAECAVKRARPSVSES